jgi:hypothetical protein
MNSRNLFTMFESTCLFFFGKLSAEERRYWHSPGDIRSGEARTLQFFGMRSMNSGGAFHRAYTNATATSVSRSA